MTDLHVIAGDIGGTKCSFALYAGTVDAPVMVAERSYPSREFESVAEAACRFLADTGARPCAACFGVAGAVIDGQCHLPNLGWTVSDASLARELGIASVRLVNDLEANAHGILGLKPAQLLTLNAGTPHAGGNCALIAAGTGLGMATMLPEGGSWRVLPSEGGHVDFAARDEREVRLWRFLATHHDRVSVERVASGLGIVNLYEFLKQDGMTEPGWLATRLAVATDRSAAIGEAALKREADICVETVEMFLSAYGAAAGNLALMTLATGGLYIGGGIAPKLVDAIPDSGFMAAFTGKGRYAGLLREIPVHIVLEPKTALHGAARLAFALS